MSEICSLLYYLGVTPDHKGFYQTASAVELYLECPGRLELVTKWLYPEVAERYQTTWGAVERNIRTVSRLGWKTNRPLLERLAHNPLEHRPRPTQLISILASSVSQRGGSLAVHGLGETVALPGKDHNVGVVDETVDEGSGKAVVPKDSVPLRELQIRGDDKTFPFIAV